MESYRTRLELVLASLSKPKISGKFNVCRRATTFTAYNVVSDLTCNDIPVTAGQTGAAGSVLFLWVTLLQDHHHAKYNDKIFHMKIILFTFAITKLVTVIISEPFLLTCITV